MLILFPVAQYLLLTHTEPANQSAANSTQKIELIFKISLSHPEGIMQPKQWRASCKDFMSRMEIKITVSMQSDATLSAALIKLHDMSSNQRPHCDTGRSQQMTVELEDAQLPHAKLSPVSLFSFCRGATFVNVCVV